MNRWLPYPLLSAIVGATWLLMQQSVAPGQLIAAAVLAVVVPRLARGFLGTAVRPQRWGAVLHLAGIVLWDIVVSNVVVARIVLSPWSQPKPAWVPVPLSTRHPTAIALFATIITNTPGTVSCVVDEARREILVHALDCDDVPAAAAQMKARYEVPLMAIFGETVE